MLFRSAHGTGTPLGDPIEIGALCSLMEETGAPLTVAAAKSLVGHTETAAGALGLVESMSQLVRQAVVEVGHLRCLNPFVATLTEGRERLLRATRAGQEYEAGGGQLAGTSSFGFSGTNAHALLEMVGVPRGRGDCGRSVEHTARAWVRAAGHPLQAGCELSLDGGSGGSMLLISHNSVSRMTAHV